MTKPRPPISTHQALDRIAGQLPGGWAEMGKLVDRDESTVRKWGDPQHQSDISIGFAIKFDVAFQRAGGSGAPLHDAYANLLKLAIAERFADQAQLLDRTRVFAKESGDAIAALIAVCATNPSSKDFLAAMREVPEALVALNDLLPLLDQLARAERSRHPP